MKKVFHSDDFQLTIGFYDDKEIYWMEIKDANNYIIFNMDLQDLNSLMELLVSLRIEAK